MNSAPEFVVMEVSIELDRETLAGLGTSTRDGIEKELQRHAEEMLCSIRREGHRKLTEQAEAEAQVGPHDPPAPLCDQKAGAA